MSLGFRLEIVGLAGSGGPLFLFLLAGGDFGNRANYKARSRTYARAFPSFVIRRADKAASQCADRGAANRIIGTERRGRRGVSINRGRRYVTIAGLRHRGRRIVDVGRGLVIGPPVNLANQCAGDKTYPGANGGAFT